MVQVKALHPNVTPDHLGAIPFWLSKDNPEPAAKQLHAAYGHGGGWDPFNGFKLNDNNSLTALGLPLCPRAQPSPPNPLPSSL